jgi:hypothetical protein
MPSHSINNIVNIIIVRFAHVDGDHLTLLNIYNSYIQSGKSSKWCEEHYFDENALKSASQIRTRLKDIFISKSLSIQEEGEGDELIMRVKKALVSGYFRQVIYGNFVLNSRWRY